MSLFVVVIFGTMGNYLFKFMHGFTFPKFIFKGYTIKPIVKGIMIPPLVGMVLFGFLARNFFGGMFEHYPYTWSSYLRSLCLAIIELRSGFDLEILPNLSRIFFISMIP
jgi:hypothetical protein